MKIVGIIPARYASTRFPGKPLADIHGKPMIWWVYQQVSKVKQFEAVYVAIDDERMASVCRELSLKYVMTRNDHPNHIARVWEVSEQIQADYYICVNGDEPLVEPRQIEKILPTELREGIYFGGAMRTLADPAETLDNAKIKLAVTANDKSVYMSRAIVPYPQGTLLFEYRKYVGIECFTKPALDFFVNTPMGRLEKIEDIDHLRFIENGIPLYFTEVDSDSISVDTPKDLEKVKELIRQRSED
jgi:3-deoxy-manno-octulosonate cytidylyltransferase (CMP-KDO synthetase)